MVRNAILGVAVAIGCLTTGACEKKEPAEPPFDGRLAVTLDDIPPISFTHALVLSNGGKSFRLYLGNKPISCKMVEGDSWPFRKGEANVRFDVAPALQADGGTRWEIGQGWWAAETATFGHDHNDSTQSDLHWPIEVMGTDTRCPSKIRFDGQARAQSSKRTLTLDGALAPFCCSKTVPLAEGGVAIKIGANVYPLSHADWIADGQTETYRVRRAAGTCSSSTREEDLGLDIERDIEKKTLRARLSGRVLPWSTSQRGFHHVSDKVIATRAKDGNHLAVNGTIVLAHDMADSAAVDVEISGVVPITAGCAK